MPKWKSSLRFLIRPVEIKAFLSESGRQSRDGDKGGGMSLWRTICLVCVFCAREVVALPAQVFKTLHSFDVTAGARPETGLVQGTDGNFYGTTFTGGANNGGTVFRITAQGTLTTLYNFCAQTGCADGYSPSVLVQATDGNFYGTAELGGAHKDGTVFKMTQAGMLTTLHSFDATDGKYSTGGLVQATDGKFYGTTWFGGAHNYGTVFKMTQAGTLATLHSILLTEGTYQKSGLVQASDGDFYGTAEYGGANNDGTVFKITPAGTLTMLHSFDGTDGYQPFAGLIQATNGNFYGTTYLGGANHAGTVFVITAGGDLTRLYSLCSHSGCSDGTGTYARLVQATDGNLYGTTVDGGANGYGTVFKITAGGKLTTLHSFDGTEGANPFAGLIQATNGDFYGTTYAGGANGYGTVFSLSVGLGPFVQTLPTSGKVGTTVIILGNNLTGSTSVTFNGTAATFKVVSSTEIKATLPKGATTGKVKVKTPSRTLTSNANFRVR